jgi:hypothetical protein
MPSIIERVKANEPDVTGYQWYLHEGENKCYIIEWFKNPQAWLTPLSNVESALPALFSIAPSRENMLYLLEFATSAVVV